MNINRPPDWLRKFYYSFKWNENRTNKNIYLTFDDGPTPEITEWVLNQLNFYKAKATFFCIGRNVERHPEIYNTIIKQGHAVGNHTYSHLKGWRTNNNEYLQDINLGRQFIKSKLFRPPYGKIRSLQIKQVKKAGYKMFMWDVLSEDYNENISPEECLANITNYSTSGSIIVFHDSVKASKNLFQVLPQALKYLSDHGYKFKKLR